MSLATGDAKREFSPLHKVRRARTESLLPTPIEKKFNIDHSFNFLVMQLKTVDIHTSMFNFSTDEPTWVIAQKVVRNGVRTWQVQGIAVPGTTGEPGNIVTINPQHIIDVDEVKEFMGCFHDRGAAEQVMRSVVAWSRTRRLSYTQWSRP